MKSKDYNMATAAEELGIDLDKFKTLMKQFLNENLNEYITRLRENIVKNNFTEITFFAHKIVGASANYQTDEITEKARKIKDAAKDRRLIDYRMILAEMEEEIKKYKSVCFGAK
ncbi:MAG: Hpt domain-containing protein [Spirochaetes bacterium]|nr:Hpt domain-containing protein [Spirochaetota bacterium]